MLSVASPVRSNSLSGKEVNSLSAASVRDTGEASGRTDLDKWRNKLEQINFLFQDFRIKKKNLCQNLWLKNK